MWCQDDRRLIKPCPTSGCCRGGRCSLWPSWRCWRRRRTCWAPRGRAGTRPAPSAPSAPRRSTCSWARCRISNCGWGKTTWHDLNDLHKKPQSKICLNLCNDAFYLRPPTNYFRSIFGSRTLLHYDCFWANPLPLMADVMYEWPLLQTFRFIKGGKCGRSVKEQ